MIFKDCTHQGRIWFPVLFDVIQNIVKYLCSINRSSLCKQGNRILVTGSEPGLTNDFIIDILSLNKGVSRKSFIKEIKRYAGKNERDYCRAVKL